MNNINEYNLLKKLKKGDSKAFLELYDRYHLQVYNWALKFVKIPAIAEDIVQDVFLKIWVIRERLNPQLSFPAFIYRICRNRVFSDLKKIAVNERLTLNVIEQFRSLKESPADLAIWNQYEVLLESAIRKLPKQRQKVFKLCRQGGKTYEEVAVELCISKNTVKEHMVMAVKNIREYFYQYGEISFILIFFFS
jgi:RNA polymerase sigma-70 factor (ECF subfamily)